MQIQSVSDDGDSLRIVLSGEIDCASSEKFYDEVKRIYDREKKNIVFDCEGLTFIDSTALGTFVRILKYMGTDGKLFSLVNLNGNVRRVFQVCSLDRIITIS